MNIFISYASENHSTAEDIATSLRNREHTVFLDQDDLPAGSTYEDRIEAAIQDASIFVFLISEHSISEGRYTLTELLIAKKKWPMAEGRLLPVLLDATPTADIPSYARSVSFLKPKGNVPAEVAIAVDGMLPKRGWAILKRALPIAALGAAAIVAYAWWPPKVAFSIVTQQPLAFEAGFFGKPDKYNIGITATNTGSLGAEIVKTTFEVEPVGALTIHSKEARDPELIAPGLKYSDYRLTSVNEQPARYRGCVHFAKAKAECSDWKPWKAKGDFLYGDAFELGDALRKNAVAVAKDDLGFLVATASPNKIFRLSETGTKLAESDLPGRPLSISTGSLGLYIGMSGPNIVAKLNPNSLEIIKQTEVNMLVPSGASVDAISNQPASLAQDSKNLWVLTRGGVSTAGLGYFDAKLTNFEMPSYYDYDVSFSLSDMRLRNGEGFVWSGRTNTTPTSIYGFSTQTKRVFGGHDFDIASCASDVMSVAPLKLLVADCKGVIWQTQLSGYRIEQLSKIDSLLGYTVSSSTWETVFLAKAKPDRYFGVLSQRVSGAGVSPEQHKISASVLGWQQGTKLIFELVNAKVLDVAGGETAFLMLLESDDGQRQLVAPAYK